MTRPPLPVLGMHRSGTSLVARMLGFAGAPIPRAATPGRTSVSANEKGFWEVPPLTQLNESILRSMGGGWSAPPPLAEAWWSEPRHQRAHHDGIRLARRYLRPPGAVWKDPRLCLTLPFWAAVISPTAPAVLVIRNPLEIAASLEARDGIDVSTGLALWERYLGTALGHLEGRCVLVVDYAQLLASPDEQIAAARGWLPQRPTATSSEGFDEFVTPTLRHTTSTTGELCDDARVTAEQRRLHLKLTTLVGDHQEFSATPHEESPSTSELLEIRRAARVRSRATSRPRRRSTVRARASLLSRRLRGRGL